MASLRFLPLVWARIFKDEKKEIGTRTANEEEDEEKKKKKKGHNKQNQN